MTMLKPSTRLTAMALLSLLLAARMTMSPNHGKNYGRLTNTLVRLWLAFCLLVLFVFSGRSAAPMYFCGTPDVGHCYGTTQWREEPEYFGAYSDITQSFLTCPGGCGGFIDDEIWLIDESSPGCIANRFGVCWVEAGYIASDGENMSVFFWADARPITQNTFNLHLLGPTDPVGVTDHFMIIKDGRVFPQTFLVFIYNNSLSTLYNGISVVPTGNPMQANRIDIGQELAGTRGASANRANFTRNVWAVQPLGPEYIFWYLAQTTKGAVTSDSPPFAEWAVDPASPLLEGGRFTTRCCL